MVDDRGGDNARIARLALRWGLVALCWQLYLVFTWVVAAFEDWYGLLAAQGALTLEQRMSHLKPDFFKWGFDRFYVWAFILLAIGSVGWLWYVGVRRALEPE